MVRMAHSITFDRISCAIPKILNPDNYRDAIQKGDPFGSLFYFIFRLLYTNVFNELTVIPLAPAGQNIFGD
jgi:hypothetical protein